MIYLGSHYYLLILENPRHMTCRIYLSMACQVSSLAISKRWGEGARSYSLVKVSIYKRVGRSRQSCKLHTLKGVPFLNRRYKIGVPYPLKIVYKRGRGWAFAFITFLEDLSHRGYKKKKEHYLVTNRSSRSLDLPRGSGMLSVLTLFRRLRLGVNALFHGLPLGNLHGETLLRGLFGWYSGEHSRSAAHSTLSLLRFLQGLELLTGCWQPLTSKVYQETRTKSQTFLFYKHLGLLRSFNK